MKKVVIAGFGFMGTMHAQIYNQLRGVRIAGIIDTHPAKASKSMVGLGLKVPLYSSLKEALADAEPDIVDICLPTHWHARFAVEALRAGRHVFCEKPLALTRNEARRIAEAAKKSGTIMQVGHCIRFWPEYQAFESLVRSGRAGKLLSLTLQRRAGRPSYSVGDWLNDSALSGGASLDLHIHDVDYIHHLIGRPRTVTSRGTKDYSGWSHIFTTYDFGPNGPAVTSEGGWNYPAQWGFQMAFQAVFEKGTVEFDSTANPTLTLTISGRPRQPLPFRAPKAGESSTGAGNVSSLGGYFNELKSFVDCVRRGRAPQVATPMQAAESLITTLTEIQSAATGKTLSVPAKL